MQESQDKLTKIRDSGTFCCLTIKSDYNFMWDIYLTISELTGSNNDHSISHHVSNEDLDAAVTELYDEVKELI